MLSEATGDGALLVRAQRRFRQGVATPFVLTVLAILSVLLTASCGSTVAPAAASTATVPSATAAAVALPTEAPALVVPSPVPTEQTAPPLVTPTDVPTTPISTDTPVPDTPTATSLVDESGPTATPTPDETVAAWNQQAMAVQRINSALADTGRRYQAGTIRQADAAAVLAQEDRDAADTARSLQTLPPPTTASAADVADVRSAATTWSSTVHRLHLAADNYDFWNGIPLARQLQTDSQRLSDSLDRLRLPG